MKFSIIIPTIENNELTKKCIKHLLEKEPSSQCYEIIIVDDGSDKKTQRELLHICNSLMIKGYLKDTNEGFPRTVNFGLKHAHGDILILMNNDVEITKPFLEEIEWAFEKDPNIWVVGAKLLYPNGSIQHAGLYRHGNQFFHSFQNQRSTHPEVNIEKYMIGVTGALFAIRRECYEQLGGYNPSYFLSCDDIEYCLKVWQSGHRVYYNPKIEAIHHEGFTRGAKEHEKQKNRPEWYQKEKDTQKQFFWRDLLAFDISGIERDVAQANGTNQKVIKLEVGGGNNPQHGYKQLDVRHFPHTDYVCDFSKEPLPIKEGYVEELISNHSIEHVSWRKLPFVLSEWFRVLTKGGRLFLRTPDLEFICRTYLEGKTTPEAKQDESFIENNLCPKVTPAWWANIKLFAGQDYDSNFHYLCFDFPMLKALLEKHGFINVKRLNVTPVFSPGEIQVEAYKPGEFQFKKKILVKRTGALGDVILTTPVIRRLREKYGRDALIHMFTHCQEAVINNPNLDAIVTQIKPDFYDGIIDLDMAYENTPKMHIVDAYMLKAFGDTKGDLSTEIFSNSKLSIDMNQLTDKGKYRLIAIHMAMTWKNRTYPVESWEKIIDQLLNYGFRVIVLGGKSDFKIEKTGVYNLHGKLTLSQIQILLDHCAGFIGNDSSLIHVAGTTNIPIVGIFTAAKAEYRLPYRKGILGYQCAVASPNLDCYGCLHEEKPPVTFVGCKRNDFACIIDIKPETVFKKTIDLLENPWTPKMLNGS